MNAAAALLLFAIPLFAASSGLIGTGKYLWPNKKEKKLNICWETVGQESEKLTIRTEVENTWGTYSEMQFVFHGKCDFSRIASPFEKDVQWVGIKVRDETPRTEGIGFELRMQNFLPVSGGDSSVAYRVILNFALNNWPKEAFGYSGKTLQQKALLKDRLIRLQAIHEFGHILGIMHENARSEAPSDCVEWLTKHTSYSKENASKERTIGINQNSYDPFSIMNYCGILRANQPDPRLSCGDVATIRHLYGTKNPDRAFCCTPDRIDSAFRGEAQWADQVAMLQKCGKDSVPGDTSGGRINNDRPTEPTEGKPTPRIPAPPEIPGSNLASSGWPYFFADFDDYKGPKRVPVEWNITLKTKTVNGITYPGFDISLRSLDSNLIALPAPIFYDPDARFYLNDPKPQVADIRLYSLGSTEPHTPFNVFPKSVQSTEVWRYDYTSTPQVSHSPPAYAPGGVFTFWIPKGHGTFDPVLKQYFSLESSVPLGRPWFYSNDPNRRYWVNNSYHQISFSIQRRFSAYISETSRYSKNRLVIDLPAHTAYPVQFFSHLRKHFIEPIFVKRGKAPDNTPVGPFWIDRTEVTQTSFQTVLGRSPFSYPHGPTYPAEGVTWYDAILYCNKRSQIEGFNPVYTYSNPIFDAGGACIGMSNLQMDARKNGYRLPTRQEWQYAYRAGSTEYWYWGNTSNLDEVSKYAWFRYNSNGSSHPVGGKIPNAWGLQDMAGNVLEWVWNTEWQGGSQAEQLGGSWYDPRESLWYFGTIIESKSERCPHAGFRVIRKATNLSPILGQYFSD